MARHTQQAVILAGGRGTRLRPFTDTKAKPMIELHGRPFLVHLIELLKDNGITDIVLLLGYLHKSITSYFGDGSQFGVRIQYSIRPHDYETGTLLVNAAPLLREQFLLLYCDNYWPLDLKRLEQFHTQHETPATVTVCTNTDGVTKNNIAVDEKGYVTRYDKQRKASGLNGVEIGFCILDKKVLQLAPPGSFSFEETILPQLIRQHQLAGYRSDQRYYSIGSHERLPLTEQFLTPKKVAFLDRDGVINKKAARADYVKKWEEFEFLPGSIEAIKLLNNKGWDAYVITNQPGIARGFMNEKDLEHIHTKMQHELKKNGAHINGLYHCPHGWDEGCSCRKPEPGLLIAASQEHHINLRKSIFIGDSEHDMEAGKAVGCRTIQVSGNNNLLRIVQSL